MVRRIFVEKKPGLDAEARTLLAEARGLLGIGSLESVRILNRYDVEDISTELFEYAVRTVFSEPQLDEVLTSPSLEGAIVFAVEYLPGQFDQRADSAAQCIQILSQGERPPVRSAKVYALYGKLSEDELAEIKKYVINPVEAREASMELPESLALQTEAPDSVPVLEGFRKLEGDDLSDYVNRFGLAMDSDDLAACRDYFRSEGRDPTLTELRVLDTYWSDHCRHTTFNTRIDSVRFEDALLEKAWQDYLDIRASLGRTKPVCLMDLATIAVRALRKAGKLSRLDESEEINACSVRIDVEADGVKEPWLLMFKNETHNHPTEIEPFGGAATCIGGAIRDPLSGRSYVYGAMRVTGAADPLVPVSETIPGKLPQRKLVTTAAAGYSSYGNQIGLATGIVDELYHPGYAAKRMEIGAVIAAAPAGHVRRERPAPGDVVILLGGSTGRDGIGGATGSSKAHTVSSVETCGAEVQKGNAPEERKLQRLFRNGEASRMIKRCNDFGAGGVSVAIGELAPGLIIDLNAVPRKYEGLDGTELAISESQERMAVVVAAEDADAFLSLAASENLQACPVAKVQAEPRLVMRWNGSTIVDLSRAFLDTNGAEKHIDVVSAAPEAWGREVSGSFSGNLRSLAQDLNCCSHRGLSERFDSTIGAGTVLMPFGGKYQLTPIQAMVQKIPMEEKHTDNCSFMSWGFNPFISEKSPYHGAYLAVVESVCRLVATGASFEDVYLSFQEYFERLGHDSLRWGKPVAALLGALEAQMKLGVGAIGGKDSMSGSFEDMHVPPTLVSFAVTTGKTSDVVSPEFKSAGNRVYRLDPAIGQDGLPEADSLLSLFVRVHDLMKNGKVLACWTPGIGGIAEGILKMAIGNGFGFRFAKGLSMQKLFGYDYGSFLVETAEDLDAELIGFICNDGVISLGEEALPLKDVLSLYEDKLEPVYACNIPDSHGPMQTFTIPNASSLMKASVRTAKPRVLIPVFPGTNCEIDSARAVRDAGAEPVIFVINNLSPAGIAHSVDQFASSVRDSQMIFIPGGFSGGDEPDGSGKFITAFFRNAAVREEVTALLDMRGGLICGICNGFQALIKLGLVPYGKIIDTDASCPTLTFNTIGRHQSRIVRTRVCSNRSPWLSLTNLGETYLVPISHGEGRFLAENTLIHQLAENGQIATQYVDFDGEASSDVAFNPNGSLYAVEGITSPDGRVFGKMGHAERIGTGLYQNVPGNYDLRMFEAAVRYFR
ncbi:MAG: phosphoribosylformylglycinamidine synthase [Oscillospiraceae bacterium]|nr:phosphoribosylformylglycinamidine synthase [Oscillospiraceae bacterium]